VVNDATAPQGAYSQRSFVAVLLNVLVIEFSLWFAVPYLYLAFYVLPLIAIDLIVALVLKSRGGMLGQIGRGMLIGLLCVPAGLLILLPGFFIAQASGLV
jgi:mannose/fructose/N-acetylgalactosamine-specific phosphotransferase system component IIC